MQAFGLVGLSLLFGCTAFGGWRLWIGWTRYRHAQRKRDEAAQLLVMMTEQAAARRAEQAAAPTVYDLTGEDGAR